MVIRITHESQAVQGFYTERFQKIGTLFDSVNLGCDNSDAMDTFTTGRKIAASVFGVVFLLAVFAAVLIPEVVAGELPYIAWCHL